MMEHSVTSLLTGLQHVNPEDRVQHIRSLAAVDPDFDVRISMTSNTSNAKLGDKQNC